MEYKEKPVREKIDMVCNSIFMLEWSYIYSPLTLAHVSLCMNDHIKKEVA